MISGGWPQKSILNLTAGVTVVKPEPGAPYGEGRIYSLSVIASGAGGIYDSPVSGSLSAGNQILAIPGTAAVGTIYTFYGGFPMSQGIVVSGSGGAVYALAYS